MSTATLVRIAAQAVCIGMFIAAPAGAQSSAPSSEQARVSQHHQAMYGLMKDMSQEMNRMTEEMSRGELTADQNKQMAQRMKRMSTLMQRMSGLQDRPAMKEPEMQKQLAQMRKQMDEMMHDKPMKPAAK